jgi:hypothetical protein
MQRRDLLRLLGGISVIAGLSPGQLLTLGQRTHAAVKRSRRGYFNPHQLHTVAAAGERIIPATDTPGALAARCELFTERIVADHFAAERQLRFATGLIDLDREARLQHQGLFIQLNGTQQDQVLSAVEAAAYEINTKGADTFWRDLKWLTLTGYYTSEIGIEQELQTDRMPMQYNGRAPLPSLR